MHKLLPEFSLFVHRLRLNLSVFVHKLLPYFSVFVHLLLPNLSMLVLTSCLWGNTPCPPPLEEMFINSCFMLVQPTFGMRQYITYKIYCTLYGSLIVRGRRGLCGNRYNSHKEYQFAHLIFFNTLRVRQIFAPPCETPQTMCLFLLASQCIRRAMAHGY